MEIRAACLCFVGDRSPNKGETVSVWASACESLLYLDSLGTAALGRAHGNLVWQW